ncbi:MAG: nucleoside monophosphate kinase [Candidatus Paceibacterota bacterium]|jgi:adenylate kinase
MQLKTVIFMGRSGSGKGTQAKLLVDELVLKGVNVNDIMNVSSGELFRAFAKDGGYTQDKIRAVMAAGNRVPDFLAVRLWGNWLVQTYRPSLNIILDGTPRSHAEARMLENALVFYERNPIEIVNIKVSNEWSIERLSARKRLDDSSLDTIKHRLAFYEDDVLEAIDYYRGSPKVRFSEINGEQTIEEVHKDVSKAVFG